MTRRPLTLAAAAAAAVACVAVVVAGLTGALTVVITHGDSMEPTYRAGDVVVVGRVDSYGVGDVAAYHSPMLDHVVLHRVVDTDGDGFVLSGDNNSWLDPERPVADDMLGTAWLHVPKLGVPARWLRTHPPMAAAITFTLVAATVTTTARRKRPVKKHAKPARRRSPAGRHDLAAGLLVGALAFGVLTAVSWSRPATTAGPVGYTHEGTFTYTATVSPGPVYDTSQVATGEPVFLNLVRDVRVGFTYRFSAEGSAAVRGTIALDAEVDNGSGWSRTLQLTEPRPFDGEEAEIAGGLDIGMIRSLVAEVAESTGEAGATTITLRPHVSVEGDVSGGPFDEDFSPSLVYQLTDTQLRAEVDGDAADPFVAHASGEVQVPGRQAAVLGWGGRGIDVASARWLSLVAALSCLVGAFALLAASRRSRGLSESERITRRWRHLIVPGVVDDLLPQRVVTVAEFAILVTLAKRSDRLIVHDRAADAFLCDLDGASYRYEPATRTARRQEAPLSLPVPPPPVSLPRRC